MKGYYTACVTLTKSVYLLLKQKAYDCIYIIFVLSRKNKKI